ncbi:MAG: 6-carboxytetrahydropterin synthase QueD [Candidatus Melainabacteria bacterium RIFOXYA12_FULL_32_12]|nr:MAG: 6-carboxytetrahydropterin synthase QueD [Candidatus Melainabacteria bacterium GWF2_32_7]OGI31049.1 MAG: 6-carboxytetrahydropterin synthase QueD [Candidatus Melainabacteria bacterium RIFOXYA12_FULL_32_12]
MFEVKVEDHFSAAHHLLNYEGECENQHGHNWKVEAYVQSEILDKSNILMDFKVLKKSLGQVLKKLDHRDINELEEFKGQSPSSEYIARYIYKELKKEIPQLTKVSVWETERARASYWE